MKEYAIVESLEGVGSIKIVEVAEGSSMLPNEIERWDERDDAISSAFYIIQNYARVVSRKFTLKG